jgi:hypothetical protein
LTPWKERKKLTSLGACRRRYICKEEAMYVFVKWCFLDQKNRNHLTTGRVAKQDAVEKE